MRRMFAALLLLLALDAAVQAAPPTAPPSAASAPSALLQFQHDLVSILALRDDATHLTAAAILARSTPNLPPVLSFKSLLARAEAATGAGAAVSRARSNSSAANMRRIGGHSIRLRTMQLSGAG